MFISPVFSVLTSMNGHKQLYICFVCPSVTVCEQRNHMNIPCILLPSINGQYANQGKLGAAVLGNHSSKEVRCTLRVRPFTSSCSPHEHVVKLSVFVSSKALFRSLCIEISPAAQTPAVPEPAEAGGRSHHPCEFRLHGEFCCIHQITVLYTSNNPRQTQKQWRGF